jgi:rhodanese-related sulfurtransferase
MQYTRGGLIVKQYRIFALILLLCAAMAASMGCDNKPIVKDVTLEEDVAIPESLKAASEEPVVPQAPAFRSLTRAEFETMSVAQGVQILNVLEPGETYPALETLPKAKITNIPLQQLLTGDFGTLDRNKKVIAICRTGNRSGQAAEFLGQNGFEAYNLEGGLLGLAETAPADDAAAPTDAEAPAETEAADPAAEPQAAPVQ